MKGERTNEHCNSDNILDMQHYSYSKRSNHEILKTVLTKTVSVFKDVAFIGFITTGTYAMGRWLGILERGYRAFGGGELLAMFIPLFYVFKKLWNTGANKK